MKNEVRLFLMRHGAVVAFLGSLTGLAYMLVITGELSGSLKAWHLAHLQGVLIGILILAVSSLVNLLSLDGRKLWILAYCYVVTGYCYSIGPVFGALVGERGIQPLPPVGNLVFYASNSIASLSILVGLGLTVYGARKIGAE